MKILVAEDDENSRHLLEVVLTSAGYEVVSFDNGLKALTYLHSKPIDLIISDILMPEMDGYGLCREVKQSQYLQKIPFIFYFPSFGICICPKTHFCFCESKSGNCLF